MSEEWIDAPENTHVTYGPEAAPQKGLLQAYGDRSTDAGPLTVFTLFEDPHEHDVAIPRGSFEAVLSHGGPASDPLNLTDKRLRTIETNYRRQQVSSPSNEAGATTAPGPDA